MNVVQENVIQPHILNQKDFRDPFDFIHPYIVSLSVDNLNKPMGSGTFVKFNAVLKSGKNTVVYAVLTATHVLEDLARHGLSENKITLLKPINRSRELCAAEFAWGLATELDYKHFMHIKEKKAGVYSPRERDAIFLLLSFDVPPKNIVTEHSDFYDLTINDSQPLLMEGDNCVYFRGACTGDEVQNNVLQNTGVFFASYMFDRLSPESKIPHLIFKYDETRIYYGASGTGMWAFVKNHDNTIKMSLIGMLFGGWESKGELYAIGRKYINETLMPLTIRMITEK